MFKVKVKGKDETLYYTVYDIQRTFDINSCGTTEFLIYDSKNGFNWVNACYCTPV